MIRARERQRRGPGLADAMRGLMRRVVVRGVARGGLVELPPRPGL